MSKKTRFVQIFRRTGATALFDLCRILIVRDDVGDSRGSCLSSQRAAKDEIEVEGGVRCRQRWRGRASREKPAYASSPLIMTTFPRVQSVIGLISFKFPRITMGRDASRRVSNASSPPAPIPTWPNEKQQRLLAMMRMTLLSASRASRQSDLFRPPAAAARRRRRYVRPSCDAQLLNARTSYRYLTLLC